MPEQENGAHSRSLFREVITQMVLSSGNEDREVRQTRAEAQADAWSGLAARAAANAERLKAEAAEAASRADELSKKAAESAQRFSTRAEEEKALGLKLSSEAGEKADRLIAATESAVSDLSAARKKYRIRDGLSHAFLFKSSKAVASAEIAAGFAASKSEMALAQAESAAENARLASAAADELTRRAASQASKMIKAARAEAADAAKRAERAASEASRIATATRAVGIVAAKELKQDEMDNKVNRLKEALYSRFVDREVETVATLAGLFANEPTFLVGPKGTAKTRMIDELAKAVSGRYFYFLLNSSTDMDALLGPINVSAYTDKENPRYERLPRGSLQVANMVFFDEPYKSTGYTRNALLDIILNKRYAEGDRNVKLPIVGMYMAANELPDDSEDEAFHDRLSIRCFVEYVGKEKWPELARKAALLNDKEHPTPEKYMNIISLGQVLTVQGEVQKRYLEALVNPELEEKASAVRAALMERNVVVSDRMWLKIFNIAAAVSVVFNDKAVDGDHLAAGFYFAAPTNKEDLKVIEDVIAIKELSPTYSAAFKLRNVFKEMNNLYTQTRDRYAENNTAVAATNLERLTEVYLKVEELQKAASGNRKLEVYLKPIRELMPEVRDFIREKKASSSDRSTVTA